MKLVTQTSLIADRLGIKKAIEMIKEAGFDGFDYSMTRASAVDTITATDYKAHVKEIKSAMKSTGLPCLQAHAPCPKVPNIISAEDYIPLTVRALEIASELECPVAVVHPANIYTAEENCDLIFSKLLPTAEKLGVKIATENMWGWNKEHTEFVPEACGTSEDFIKNLDLLPSPYFTACVDIGHAQMKNAEGAAKMIRTMGKKYIGALHVHDNDLINDTHTFPYCGKSDWEEITSALAEIGYDKLFTYEADSFMTYYPDELIPACLKLLHDTGRYLISKIEEKRK